MNLQSFGYSTPREQVTGSLLVDEIGQVLHERRQTFVSKFYWQTKPANFIDHLTSPEQHRNEI